MEDATTSTSNAKEEIDDEASCMTMPASNVTSERRNEILQRTMDADADETQFREVCTQFAKLFKLLDKRRKNRMLGLLFSLQAPHFTPDDRVALLTDLKQSLQDFQPKNFVQTRSSNDTALDTDDELSRDNQRMIEKCAIFVLEALDQGDLDDSQLLQIYDGVITRMKPLKAVPRNEGGSPVSSVTAASDEAIPLQDANSVAETAESDEAVRLPETMS